MRQVIRDIGYNDSSHGFDSESCGVMVSLKAQSPEIAGGVGSARCSQCGEAGRRVALHGNQDGGEVGDGVDVVGLAGGD